MGGKKRIFQIARDLNISNEAAISFLAKLDSSIRNQMSPVSDKIYEEICKKYKKDTVTTAEEGYRQQLKEKQLLDELRRTKARKELEERIRVATKIAEERPRKKKEISEIRKKKVEEKKIEPVKAAELLEIKEKIEEEASVVERISRAKKAIEKKEKLVTVEKKGRIRKPEKEISKEVVSTTSTVTEEEIEAEVEGTVDAKKKEKIALEAKEKLKPEKEKKKIEEVTSEQATEGIKDKAKRKHKKKKKRKISEEEIEESIRQTLAAMEEAKPKRRKRKGKETLEELVEENTNVIKVSEFISTTELAELLNVDPTEVIKKCLELGMMVSINQRLDMDTIVTVADEFDHEVEIIQDYGAELIDKMEEDDLDEESSVSRSPVVTIMGHVDHGKTSLLDYIRKSNIIGAEVGGITQHIGAYEVAVDGRAITFLDTPGHEAFTAMRARGAQITDLVVLIVAADDGVQPQTIEAINHAKAAGVPIVVAINKIDKTNSNPDSVKQQLSENDILVESWGGKYQSIEISAKTGKGIDKLLEMILLEAEILELAANPDRKARGIIIESKLDRGKGPVATILVQNGTLKVGDLFIAGQFSGKVRAMHNERNRKVDTAPPSTPVQVVGFDGVPQAGDAFIVMDSEKEVREISSKRRQLRREQDFRLMQRITLDQISQQIRHGQMKALNLIVRADVDGSVEALSDALMKLSNKEVSVNVIHKAVGGISESDILLASASQAVILGFQIRPTLKARELAEKEEVEIHLYSVIYDAVDDIKSALEGLLDPEITEEITSTVEVRSIFRVPKVGVIAGCYILSGKVTRNDLTKVYRDDRLIYETKISSLKRFKDDAREVTSGFECGIGLDGFDDIKISDVIETYKKVETARKL